MLLTKNEIKAVKKLVFIVIRRTLKISKVKDVDFDACDVDLQSVLVWAISLMGGLLEVIMQYCLNDAK